MVVPSGHMSQKVVTNLVESRPMMLGYMKTITGLNLLELGSYDVLMGMD